MFRIQRMEDRRKPGCSMTIRFNKDAFSSNTLDWVRNHSGLTKAYADKILAARIIDYDTKRQLLLQFDDSCNCFEAMRQISQSESNYKVDDTLWIEDIICPRGRFAKVRRFYRSDPRTMNLDVGAEQMARYGDLLAINRRRIKGVCTGDLEAVMFLRDGSQLLDDNWINASGIYAVKSFFEVKNVQISTNAAKKLWEKYGPVRQGGNMQLVAYDRMDLLDGIGFRDRSLAALNWLYTSMNGLFFMFISVLGSMINVMTCPIRRKKPLSLMNTRSTYYY